MTRFVGYIAMSLDGRIADEAGGMDWLAPFADPAEDFGYAAFYAGVDALVMGRATYDFVAAQPDWPYPGKTTYVVTGHTLTDRREGVVAVAPDFDALRARLLAGPDSTIWIVGGGRTQRGALDADMFDEMRLFVMPVVLGSGPLVFGDGATTGARLTGHRVWPGGVVELSYGFPDGAYAG